MNEKHTEIINSIPEDKISIINSSEEQEIKLDTSNLDLEQEIIIENLNLEQQIEIENLNLEQEIKPELEFNVNKINDNYEELENKPSINGIELIGNKTSEELGINEYDDSEIKEDISNLENNKADRTEIPDVSNFITNAVNNLTNYYLKSETYTKEEVNNIVGQISTLKIKVVEELPSEGHIYNLLKVKDRIYETPNGREPSTPRPFTGNSLYDSISANNYWIPGQATSSISNEEITTRGKNGYGLGLDFNCESGKTYTVSYQKTNEPGFVYIGYFNENGEYLSTRDGGAYYTTFTTPENCKHCILVFRNTNQIDTTFSNIMLTKGNEVPSEYRSFDDNVPSEVEENTIYFLLREEPEQDDYYEEWIYVNDKWELIGTTKINLDGYATETWVNNQISNFLTQSQIETLINNAISQIEIPTKTSELENDSGYITSFVNVPSTKLSVYANNDEGRKYLRVTFMGKNEDFLKLCNEGKVKLYLYKYTRTGKKSWTDTHGNTRENTSIKKWVHPANRYYDVGERPDLQCWGVMSLARTIDGGVEKVEEIIGDADYAVGKDDCGYVVSEYDITSNTFKSGHFDILLNDIMSAIVRVSSHGNANLLLPTSGDDYTVHMMGARKKTSRAREIQPIRYCLAVDMEDGKHTKYVGDCLNTAQLELFTYRATWDNCDKHGYLTKYSFLDDVGYGVRII